MPGFMPEKVHAHEHSDRTSQGRYYKKAFFAYPKATMPGFIFIDTHQGESKGVK